MQFVDMMRVLTRGTLAALTLARMATVAVAIEPAQPLTILPKSVREPAQTAAQKKAKPSPRAARTRRTDAPASTRARAASQARPDALRWPGANPAPLKLPSLAAPQPTQTAQAPVSKPDVEKPAPTPPAASPADERIERLVKTYCGNLAPKAEESRRAWQAQQLADLEARIEKKIADLEARKSALEALIEAQKKQVAKADQTLVALYARMRPDSAAAQLASMDPALGAQLLAALDAKTASNIVNEMEPDAAARVTRAMAPASRMPAPPAPQPANQP